MDTSLAQPKIDPVVAMTAGVRAGPSSVGESLRSGSFKAGVLKVYIQRSKSELSSTSKGPK